MRFTPVFKVDILNNLHKEFGKTVSMRWIIITVVMQNIVVVCHSSVRTVGRIRQDQGEGVRKAEGLCG